MAFSAAAGVGVFTDRGDLSNATFGKNTLEVRSGTEVPEIPEGLLGEDVKQAFMLVKCVAHTSLGVLGTLGNILNLIVLGQMGFRDTVNISLAALAVSDTGSLLSKFWMGMCFNPLFQRMSGLPFDFRQVQYLTAGWPQIAFSRMTAYITTYIAFERCVCVALPLKAKLILTPNRALSVIATICVIIIAAVAPVFFFVTLGPINKEVEARNKTDNDSSRGESENSVLIGIVYTKRGRMSELISHYIMAFFQMSSVLFTIICTVILVRSLAAQTRWRQQSVHGGQTESVSRREVRLVKMVVSVTTVFILTYTPAAAVMVVNKIVIDFSIMGRYSILYMVVWTSVEILESVNSSVNIFIYYSMNAKYRSTFDCIFFGKHAQKA